LFNEKNEIVNFHRVRHGKEQIEREMEDLQGDSSRSWLTSLIITIPASGRIVNNGRPRFWEFTFG
jgi:hypothetical protein